MAALDFPDAPTVGQVFDRWTWNGTTWTLTGGSAGRIGTWTPTLTNMAIGTGGGAGVAAGYAYNPGVLAIDVGIVFGTTGFSMGTTPSLSLPPGFTASRSNASMVASLGVGLIAGGAFFDGMAVHDTTTSIRLLAKRVDTTYAGRAGITATVPATWAANDQIIIAGTIKGMMT